MEFDIQNDRKKTSNLSDIGSKLRSGRESAEQDLTYCADHLNIPIEYLDAIEKENYYVLPGWPYTIKCIKLYANYLDINAELLINDLYRKYELEKILHANKKHYKHINIFWHVFRFCFFSFLLMVIISILINLKMILLVILIIYIILKNFIFLTKVKKKLKIKITLS